MSIIRNRAKENFPMVLVTLLSIVQALALELLWDEIHQHPELYELSWVAVFSWVRITTTFLGIILIWLNYATNSMRFRWVPSTLDSLFPFLVGILQFVMVDNLGQESVSLWIFLLAVLFAVMNGISHFDMRRARQSIENSEFFQGRGRATLRDFLPSIVIILVMCCFSLGIWLTGSSGWLARAAAVFALYIVVQQMIITDNFWRWSMSLDNESEDQEA